MILYACLYVCMDGWMYVCMDVSMAWMFMEDPWMHGCMDGWMDGWMHAWCMDAWMHGYMLYSTYCISYVLCVILPIPGQVLKHMAWYIHAFLQLAVAQTKQLLRPLVLPMPLWAAAIYSLVRVWQQHAPGDPPYTKISSLNLHSGVPLLRGTPWCCTKIQADLAAY